MKRLAPVPFLLALTLVLGACGSFGRDDVVASVNGRTVTVAQVDDLVKALASAGSASTQTAPTTTIAATQSGDAARGSLRYLVRGAAAEQLVATHHIKITAADTQTGEQAVQGAKLKSSTKDALVRGFAAQSALVREESSKTDSAFLRKLRAQLLAQVPADQRDLVCADGLIGPSSAADQVKKLLDSGTAITDTQAFAAAGFQSLNQSAVSEFCVAPTTLPAELQPVFANAKQGELTSGEYTTQDQQGQSVTGTVFFTVTSRRTLTAGDPQIAAAIQKNLANDPSPIFDAYRSQLHVVIDPRYGSGWSAAAGVTPPPAPFVKPVKASPLSLSGGATSTTP